MLYLLSIVVTFGLWYFGFHLAYYEFYVVGFIEMQRLFAITATISITVMYFLFLWSYYNVFLIKILGERRGSQISICFDKDMANLFHIDSDVLDKIKKCPAISVTFNQDGIFLKAIDLWASQGK
jgi:poly-beta-1,6-N-acetyl-D-glucosamine biosynthesis protein PgaD